MSGNAPFSKIEIVILALAGAITLPFVLIERLIRRLFK